MHGKNFGKTNHLLSYFISTTKTGITLYLSTHNKRWKILSLLICNKKIKTKLLYKKYKLFIKPNLIMLSNIIKNIKKGIDATVNAYISLKIGPNNGILKRATINFAKDKKK